MQDKDAEIALMIARGAEATNLLEKLIVISDHYDQERHDVAEQYDKDIIALSGSMFLAMLQAIRTSKDRVANLTPTEEDLLPDYDE